MPNSLERRTAVKKADQQVTTFLMFAREHHGKAKAAIACYVALFANSRIESLECYGAGEREPEGTVKSARFTLNGQQFMAMDSAAPHPFTFTPAISLFVECESQDEIGRLYNALSTAGQVLMPLDDYGFSKQFGWVNDRFGLSWQLNLAAG
jgi:predicted 3-demethylubiquinone-9 3-methyltransferase (glyoxalase superfamily)